MIEIGNRVEVIATHERGVVVYVAVSFAMVKVDDVEIPVNYAHDELSVLQRHVYQVGDRGFLENGIDTYRVLATDGMQQDGTTFIATLVVSNSASNPGYVNIREQSMGFDMRGRHPLDYQFGGVTDYNLTPPNTTPTPKQQKQSIPVLY